MPDNSNKMTSGFWYGMMHIQNRENPQELGMSLDRGPASVNHCRMEGNALSQAMLNQVGRLHERAVLAWLIDSLFD